MSVVVCCGEASRSTVESVCGGGVHVRVTSPVTLQRGTGRRRWLQNGRKLERKEKLGTERECLKLIFWRKTRLKINLRGFQGGSRLALIAIKLPNLIIPVVE